MKTKEKANRIELGFFGREYACAYIGLRTQANYIHMHTLSLRTHAKHVRANTHEEP